MSIFRSKKKYAETLKQLNDIGIALSSENNISKLLEMVLEKAKKISNSDNGFLYLVKNNKLVFEIIQSDSLGIKLGGTTGNKIPFDPIPLNVKNDEHQDRVSLYVYKNKVSVNTKNVYADKRYDFATAKYFDKIHQYYSKSVLAVPLKTKKGDVLGILQLVNPRSRFGRIIPFSNDAQHFVESLASQAAVALDNQELIREQEELIDGIIRMIALAIDKKSKHTSRHCEAIPVIVEMIAKAACKQRSGYFKDFDLTEEDWYELKVAAWLHDCGKLSTPLSILDKSTKLETIIDRISLIETRFEVLLRDIKIRLLKNEITPEQYEEEEKQIKDNLKFLKELNIGSEFVSDEKIARLDAIAGLKWQPLLSSIKKEQNILSDDEYKNLSIRKGTINAEERKIINNHMDVTIEMLESLPLPRNLKNVPEYAGGHHEKMDGTGFPRGLKRDEMSIPARMMAVADIFEALTANDRPYKEPKKISEALEILAKMKKNNHIDPDIFDLFMKEKVYMQYAKKFLLPQQIDKVDVKKILEISK